MLNPAVEIIRIPFPVILLHFVKYPQDLFYLTKTLNLSHNHTNIGLQDHSGEKAEIIEQATLHPRRQDLKTQVLNALKEIQGFALPQAAVKENVLYLIFHRI